MATFLRTLLLGSLRTDTTFIKTIYSSPQINLRVSPRCAVDTVPGKGIDSYLKADNLTNVDIDENTNLGLLQLDGPTIYRSRLELAEVLWTVVPRYYLAVYST